MTDVDLFLLFICTILIFPNSPGFLSRIQDRGFCNFKFRKMGNYLILWRGTVQKKELSTVCFNPKKFTKLSEIWVGSEIRDPDPQNLFPLVRCVILIFSHWSGAWWQRTSAWYAACRAAGRRQPLWGSSGTNTHHVTVSKLGAPCMVAFRARILNNLWGLGTE